MKDQLSGPIKKNSISYEIADRILASIMSGAFSVGDRLPSERELAETMNVSRTSVREALKMLSFSKIVDSKPGAGTFVINSPADAVAEEAEEEILKDAALRSLEVRMIAEPKFARLAAIYAKEELMAMESLVMQMIPAAEKDDYSAYSLLDMKLHLLIATSTRNKDLPLLLSSYSGSAMHLTLVKQVVGELKISLRHHMEIVQAIRNRDSDLAEKNMCQHLEYVAKKYAESVLSSNANHETVSERYKIIMSDKGR